MVLSHWFTSLEKIRTRFHIHSEFPSSHTAQCRLRAVLSQGATSFRGLHKGKGSATSRRGHFRTEEAKGNLIQRPFQLTLGATSFRGLHEREQRATSFRGPTSCSSPPSIERRRPRGGGAVPGSSFGQREQEDNTSKQWEGAGTVNPFHTAI